jgi:sterol desaturase/sphingolipid hydroxylase (fatty acid hydroxylase superfamily)
MGFEHALWYVLGAGFVLTGLAETFVPFRTLPSSTSRRWTSNLVLLGASSLLAALIFQVSAVALAVSVRHGSHGLLNRAWLPFWMQFAVGVASIDFLTYGVHRLFHRYGFLWRVHEAHHAESDLDLTTGFRFHPVESLVQQGALLAVVLLLGPPPLAIVLVGVIQVLQDYVQHANMRFPRKLDRLLQTLFVTPAMHRVHHSILVPLQNKNFGTIFSWWDRLFGTYAVQESGQEARFGVEEVENGSELNAVQLLALPFRGAANRFTALSVRSRSQVTE